MEVKARHIKMKGTPFNSKLNYHYNMLLKKVAGCLALVFLKIVFLENLPLWTMCSWAFIGGLGQKSHYLHYVGGQAISPVPTSKVRLSQGSLQCCGLWSLFPTHAFCKATLLILGTNSSCSRMAERGAGCMPLGAVSFSWLSLKVQCKRAAATL